MKKGGLPRLFFLEIAIAGWLLMNMASAAEKTESPELSWSWQLSAQQERLRARYFAIQAEQRSTQSLDGLLNLSMKWYRWTGMFAWHGKDLLTTDTQVSTDQDVTIQELFWQSDVEMAGIPLDLTVGKMRLDWGVGYGYRPLDLFKAYPRNPVGIQVKQGPGVAMLSYFDGVGEWAAVASDASWAAHNAQTHNALEEKQTQQHGIGLRRYALLGDTEWQGLAYYDQIRRGIVAGSVVTVLSPAWELHGSFALQNYYPAYRQYTLDRPVTLETYHHGYQMLVGVNWADTGGLNVIGEYWYDNRSWSQSMWRQAIRRSALLARQIETEPLAQSYALGLNHTNLVRHNLMLHVNLDPIAWRQWQWSRDTLWLGNLEPTLDLLVSPADGGVIATQWLSYKVYDSGNSDLKIELAARFYTGPGRAVYANLPDQHMILVNIKGSF
jgi:hypothetical protein